MTPFSGGTIGRLAESTPVESHSLAVKIKVNEKRNGSPVDVLVQHLATRIGGYCVDVATLFYDNRLLGGQEARERVEISGVIPV